MPNEYYNTRRTAPDEITVTIVDFKPDKPEPEVEPLRLGLAARDTCGDGTDEFLHIEPLVTWQVFPVPVFLESSIPGGLRSAVITSFEAFNKEAGFKLYEFTDNLDVAKVRVSIGPIDVAGNTIARAQWSYRISTKEITRATITFDSNENWGALSNESCGRTGNIFDCANVGTHEFGHISGLSHAPTDQLQTMYASTSPGKTLGRTLGNGDKKGFKLAYKVVTPPPPPENRPPIANSFGVQTEQDKPITITLQATDPDNDPITTFQIINKPLNGNITFTTTTKVTYTPNTGFTNTDTFTYRAIDSKGASSNIATVTINVKAVTPEPPKPTKFPIPIGFKPIGDFDTNFQFWNRFETNYRSGGSGPSLRFENKKFEKLNVVAGYEFKIGPAHGSRGDDGVDIKFPRCAEQGGDRGVYIPALHWHADGSTTEANCGSEWPHPTTSHHPFNLEDLKPDIGNVKDGKWHGYLAACYNDKDGNVILKLWCNPKATGKIEDYVYMGASMDNGKDKRIKPAPKLAFSAKGHSGGTHPMQIRIDEIPSKDLDNNGKPTGDYKFPSDNFDIRNMFAVEVEETDNVPPPPPPPPPHKHELTKEQKEALVAAELQYRNALKSGDENGIRLAKENLDKIRTEILVELHS